MKIFEFDAIKIDSSSGFLDEKTRGIIFKFTIVSFLLSTLVYFINIRFDDIIYIPIILSTFIFGIPHGAADHLFLWGFTKRNNILTKLVLIKFYLLVAFIYLLAWFYFPLESFIFFIIMTIYHWGKSDYIYGLISRGLKPGHYMINSFYTLLRGSIPILIPGIFFNEQYNEFILQLCSMIIGTVYKDHIYLDTKFFIIICFLILITFYSLNFIFEKFKMNLELSTIDHFEIFLLTLWFMFLPPLYAIGIYFIFWHSFRHIVRILALDSKKFYCSDINSLKNFCIRYFQLFSVMTLLSVLLFLILFIFMQQSSYIESIVNVLLLLIASLTLPHTLTVFFMDILQTKLIKFK